MTIDFCQRNATLLPIWQDGGISPCLYSVVKTILIFVIPLVKFLYHQYFIQKSKKKDQAARKKFIEQVGLIQSVDDSVDIEDVYHDDKKAHIQKCFKDFSFPELPLPFLYAAQISLHAILVIIPPVHIITKLIIEKSNTVGVDILSAVLSTLSWSLALKSLQYERFHFFMQKVKRHSMLMLIFWTLALLFELVIFVSWNSYQWFLVNGEKNTLKTLDLVMFCLRLSSTVLLFALGLHGPGLYDKKYENLEGAGSKKSEAKKNPLQEFWEQSKKLWPFIWPRNNFLRFRVLVCVFLLAIGRVVNVFVPIYNKKIVNYLTDSSNKDDPWKLILVYMSLSFMQGGGGIGSNGLIGNLRDFIWIKVQQYTSRSVQVQLFEHLHNLSLKWHLQRKTGEVIRMVDRGSSSIESLLSYILFQIVPTIVDIIIAIIFFGNAFNGWFALIVFLTMFFYILSTVAVTEWRTKYRREMNTKDNITKAVAVDSLLNFETVKYYNNEHFEVNRYAEKIDDYQYAQWMTQVTLNFLNISQNIVITAGLLAGMLYCGKLVVEGQLSVGDFVLFLSYVRQLYAPLNFFGTYYRLIQAAFIDMENMFDLLGEKVEVVDVEDAPELKLNHGLIEFRDVHFYYDERKCVLSGVSFTVLPGQTVALVGPSGSGKSTIIRLLFRFYDIADGSILIDGQDIRQVDQKTLRQCIGVVPQDTVLFNDSIRYNIRYGRVDSSDSQVEEAAASADIHVKINGFPEGYATVVGERGLKLSGGEKQRVAIARTLLKSPDIVLLDEATSALDTQTERNIQASLNRVCANKTTIVVAHRLSTIIGADQILVLKDGVIVERGRHHELIDKDGLYAAMWSQQLREGDRKENSNPSLKKDQ